jgi:hypothetical protein
MKQLAEMVQSSYLPSTHRTGFVELFLNVL